MEQIVTDAHVSEERRREIFLALVEAQDDEMPVDLSRKAIAERFRLTEETLQQIEREGLDNVIFWNRRLHLRGQKRMFKETPTVDGGPPQDATCANVGDPLAMV
jgi:hypothetical protein